MASFHIKKGGGRERKTASFVSYLPPPFSEDLSILEKCLFVIGKWVWGKYGIIVGDMLFIP